MDPITKKATIVDVRRELERGKNGKKVEMSEIKVLTTEERAQLTASLQDEWDRGVCGPINTETASG
jgi:hypothetical protein